MEITLNITEDSKVEMVKDNCEAVQGEKNVTVLFFNLPSTIKGYPIENYIKHIEFGECKELGECKKFYDVLEDNHYKLCDICTQFEKLLVQIKLTNIVDEAEPIIWKSLPFALEFCESINAEQTKEAQAVLLSLEEIKKEWANYIKTNTLRMIYKVIDVPTADASSLGDTIFYLGANATSPYTLTYGHYYRCNYVDVKGAYEWTDLTRDPSLEDVANGIREINNNQSMQIWVGSDEDLKNEAIQNNVIYMAEDHDIKAEFNDVLNGMAEDEKYKLAYPIINAQNILKHNDEIIPKQRLIYNGVDLLDTEIPIELNRAVESYQHLKLKLYIYDSVVWADIDVPVIASDTTRLPIHFPTPDGLKIFDVALYFEDETHFKINSIYTQNNEEIENDYLGQIQVLKIYQIIE